MTSRRTEIEVGITVLVALGVLIWGVTWLKEFSIERKVRVWHVSFPQSGGLGASDEVQVNGIRKGAVQSMQLVGDHVVVDLALSSEIRLTRLCRVAIRNVGLMGEKVIGVDLKQGGEPYTARDTIEGVYEQGLPEIAAGLGEAMGAISLLADELRDVTKVLQKSGDLAKTLENFRKTSEELKLAVVDNRAMLKTTVENFSAASQTTKRLTTDREADLKRGFEDFASAAGKMDKLAGRLDSLRSALQSVTGKLDSGTGTLARLINDDKLYQEMSAATHSVKALIEDIRLNPKKYFKVEIF
ncbi:MAG TPA: MlaD family protein [Candidatus Eisenbacteria bacterium]|jgi:phospholipid/cholesterol/gamma-HCH transport system substrate-binding protein